jgi:hypothetical protein
MSLIIQLRRDTSTRWAEQNPILAVGEVGFETDTRFYKVGNGYTAYNFLPYSFGDPVDYLTEAPTDNFQYARQNGTWQKVASGLPAPIRETVSAGTTQIIDSLDGAVYRSAKWMMTFTDGFNGTYRTSEVMAFHNGTSAEHVQYAMFGTSLNYSVDVQYFNSQLRLRVTNSEPVALTIDAVRVANLNV